MQLASYVRNNKICAKFKQNGVLEMFQIRTRKVMLLHDVCSHGVK